MWTQVLQVNVSPSYHLQLFDHVSKRHIIFIWGWGVTSSRALYSGGTSRGAPESTCNTGIKLGSVVCKEDALSPVLSLQEQEQSSGQTEELLVLGKSDGPERELLYPSSHSPKSENESPNVSLYK